MKIRLSFVSNSSSSSFVIDKDKLTEDQLDAIRTHTEYARARNWYESYSCDCEDDCDCVFPRNCEYDDPWKISEDDSTISGRTIVDNFSMEAFFQNIGVDDVKFEDW